MTRLSCFFVTPIGDQGSPQRVRCDQIQNYILARALGSAFDIIRADAIVEPGQISAQIIELIDQSDLVVADLTGLNANVMYELGIRHAANRPTIQIMDSKEKLPFDLYGERTIFFDITDLNSVEICIRTISRFVEKIFLEKKTYMSPVANALGAALLARPRISDILDDIKDSVASIEADISLMEFTINSIEGEVEDVKQVVDDIRMHIDDVDTSD